MYLLLIGSKNTAPGWEMGWNYRSHVPSIRCELWELKGDSVYIIYQYRDMGFLDLFTYMSSCSTFRFRQTWTGSYRETASPMLNFPASHSVWQFLETARPTLNLPVRTDGLTTFSTSVRQYTPISCPGHTKILTCAVFCNMIISRILLFDIWRYLFTIWRKKWNICFQLVLWERCNLNLLLRW